MSLTFTTLKTRIKDMLSDTSSATDTLAGSLVNESYRTVFDLLGRSQEGSGNIISVTNDDTYDISGFTDYDRMMTVKVITAQTTGTTDGTTSNKLVDSTASFAATLLGKIVYNKTDSTSGVITAVDSATQLTLDTDIFTSGETYSIGDGIHYLAEEVRDEETWNFLKASSVDSTSNVISHYYIRNKVLEIYPKSSNNNDIIRITYQAIVSDLSGSDVPDIPEQYHPMLTYMPISELFLRREELTLANKWEAKWNKALREVAQHGASKTEGITVRLTTNKAGLLLDQSKDSLVTT